MNRRCTAGASRGFSLIEVLITIIIIAIGLLGLAGMQMTSLNNQFEAYQRAQALLRVEDMANRIRANAVQAKAGAYTVDDDYGQQAIEDCTTKAVGAERDMCDWNVQLAGTGVTLDGANIGSVVGVRGCIEDIPGSADGETIIRVTVAWLGMNATSAPSSDCGRDDFGATEDNKRRVVSVDTVLANLAIP